MSNSKKKADAPGDEAAKEVTAPQEAPQAQAAGGGDAGRGGHYVLQDGRRVLVARTGRKG